MILLPELTIYISHTCDIACDHCFTYNNLNWGGHFEVRHEVDSLKNQVIFEEVFIVGGEPTLNPHLDSWMAWIEMMWPTSKKWLVTNGRNLKDQHWRKDWFLEISAHSPNDLSTVLTWLDSRSISYDKFYNDQHSDASWHYKLYKDGSEVGELSESWLFYKSHSILTDKNPISWMPLQDKYEQHKLCPSKYCLHLIEGRFYRCPQQALLPKLSEIFHIDHNYKILAGKDLGCDTLEFSNWIKTKDEPQDQCMLCHWNTKVELPHESKINKIKILKI